METSVVLNEDEMKLWAIMKALQAVGAFNVKYGKVTIDFGAGKIGNIKVEENYRITEFTTV